MLPGMSQKRARAARAASPRTPKRAPQTVRATGPADLLRHIPDLLPVEPVDSLVVVLFRRSAGTRSRSHGGMRVDLQHTDDPERLAAWASSVLGMVLQVEGVTGVAIAAYTPEPFAPSGRPPAAVQVRAVAKQAERMGLEVLHRFVVAPDGWAPLGDPDLPRGGYPLALIDPDGPRRPRVDPLGEPDPASRAQRERFQEQYAAWWRRRTGPGGELHGVDLDRSGAAPTTAGPSWMGPPPSQSPMDRFRYGLDLHALVDLVEGILEPHDHAEAPCACRALLAAIVERQGMIAMLLAQVGWGAGFGREVWTAFADPQHRLKSHHRMLDALGGAFRRPDVERIDAAIAALLEVRTYRASPRVLSGVDEALAWLHWASGASSTAAKLAERSLLSLPDRDLAPIVLERAERGMLPGWAYRRDASKPDPYRALLAAPERAAG